MKIYMIVTTKHKPDSLFCDDNCSPTSHGYNLKAWSTKEKAIEDIKHWKTIREKLDKQLGGMFTEKYFCIEEHELDE